MARPLTQKFDWLQLPDEKISEQNRFDKIPFTDIFKRFLLYDSTKTCIEIGCNPGYYLVHLYKHYGFKVFGIDYVDIECTRKNLQYFKVSDFYLEEVDFLNWRTDQMFDVVFSSGFIEHFDDYHELFKMHCQLIKPGGKLILTIPNFRYGQYLFHWLTDRNIFQTHNLAIMKPSVLRSLCQENKLEVIYLNYYQTIEFWIDNIRNKKLWLKIIFRPIVVGARLINQSFSFIHHIPNRWFSPFIVLVGQKPI